MNYGMYLSATGVVTNSYRQDVISNNLANSETIGFKKDLALFQERLTEAQSNRLHSNWSDPLLGNLAGGLLASPTETDQSQGDLEHTGNNLDLAIAGSGFFQVQTANGQNLLTRDGRFMLDKEGNLILANETGQKVLDRDGKPIKVIPGDPVSIDKDGTISQASRPVARIGLFDVPDPAKLVKQGQSLFTASADAGVQPSKTAWVRNEFVERANVDPTTELAELMDAQRSLEANANMIRYQDQMLSRLVNDVGKIS